MQYVNDDMDELFRKAAENYPLDTNTANWNKVVAALQGPDQPQRVKGKKGRLLWLLLLLPLGLICTKLYSPGNESGEGTVSRNKISVNKKGGFRAPSNKQVEVNKTESSTSKEVSGVIIEKLSNVVLPPRIIFKATGPINTKKDLLSEPLNATTNQTVNVSSEYTSLNNLQFHFTRYIPPIAFTQNKQIPLREFSPAVNFFGPVPNPQKQKKELGFYAGFVAGIDFTTVKFQKIKGKGYNFGLILGYQATGQWSFESGLYWNDKFYYTDGRYFSASKVYLPPNTWIDEVWGNCQMIELPLNVRYRFSTNGRSAWVGGVGASSYFMKQEKYNYLYYWGNSGVSANYYKNYKSSAKYFFAAVQLSGGYTRRVGKLADLRIEPYLKLPLTGVGTGKLPLFSTGVHFGITRKF